MAGQVKKHRNYCTAKQVTGVVEIRGRQEMLTPPTPIIIYKLFFLYAHYMTLDIDSNMQVHSNHHNYHSRCVYLNRAILYDM